MDSYWRSLQNRLGRVNVGRNGAGAYKGFSTGFLSSPSYTPPNSKAMAFPIVAFALVLTALVLYTTGNSNSESTITLLSVALFCLFGSLVYAFWPGMTATPHINWSGIGLAFVAAIVAMFAILLIVHYTIRPIFKVRNSGPGFIPVPTVGPTSTGLYWIKSTGLIKSIDTVLLDGDDGTYNYSMSLDILIKDPNVSSNIDRPIFSRSDANYSGAPVTSEGVTIAQQIGNYNLAFYLDKSTNDLIVSTMSSAADHFVFENAIIENVPVQKPFRIGVVLGSKYMEVYFNGKLHSTRELGGTPLPISGAFMPPGNAFAAMADVRNLRLWKGTITPAEMAYLPALSLADFGEQTTRSLTQIADSINGLCGAGTGVSTSVLGEVVANMGAMKNVLSGSQDLGDIFNSLTSTLGSGSATGSMMPYMAAPMAGGAIGGSASALTASISGSVASMPASASAASQPASASAVSQPASASAASQPASASAASQPASASRQPASASS